MILLMMHAHDQNIVEILFLITGTYVIETLSCRNKVLQVMNRYLLVCICICMYLYYLCIGRLHQVEYAIEAINNAGTCIGLQSSNGIVLAAEKKVVSKLLAKSKTSEKTYTIDDHVICLVAGLTADANILIQQSRLNSQRLGILQCCVHRPV